MVRRRAIGLGNQEAVVGGGRWPVERKRDLVGALLHGAGAGAGVGAGAAAGGGGAGCGGGAAIAPREMRSTPPDRSTDQPPALKRAAQRGRVAAEVDDQRPVGALADRLDPVDRSDLPQRVGQRRPVARRDIQRQRHRAIDRLVDGLFFLLLDRRRRQRDVERAVVDEHPRGERAA